MQFKTLVEKNRSYRRFDESVKIDRQTLIDLIDLARHTASAANFQPLKYIFSFTPESNALVFESLGWAGYLPDWPGPGQGERPTAYIVVLKDTKIQCTWADIDSGIAIQTMLLGAVEQGLGGVIFGNVKKKELKLSFSIPDDLEVLLVLALGKPIEKIVLEDVAAGGSIKYYREPDGTHHVPKWKLNDIIVDTI
jgi:nitroreductase